MDVPALSLTLRLAAITTALLLIIAMPLAAWIATTPTLAQKLVLPPTVLGFYLLTGLGPATALGRTLIRLLGHPLAFTFTGLVVGSMIYSLPFAVQPMVAAFTAVPRSLTETAAVLGAPPLVRFLRITLPLSRAGILTAAVLTFAHTLGEFGVVLMIGGDIPGLTRTLSIAIFDQVQEGNYTAANHTALWLLAASFAALFLIYARTPRRSAQ
jgi:molybdate transport system permease protein